MPRPNRALRSTATLAAVVAFSPDSHPERFPAASDELVYWIQAYNAYVIRAVLERWPLASVTDVKAPIEAVRGLGFFYRLRYGFGGEYYSLFAVEHNIIRKRHRDARIHFVLNCGSESCPVLRPELPTGNALEETLAQAAADFVADPANVAIDHDARTITLSRIFKWFRKDFENDLRLRGLPVDNGLVDYVANVAPDRYAGRPRASTRLRTTILRLRLVRQQPVVHSTTRPGLSIPVGSSACFIDFISAISLGFRDTSRYGRFSIPIPCSAEIDPW